MYLNGCQKENDKFGRVTNAIDSVSLLRQYLSTRALNSSLPISAATVMTIGMTASATGRSPQP